MQISTLLSAFALIGSTFAAPARLAPRQAINANGTTAAGSGITDLDILQFALTLEYFEITVYEAGVNAFSDADFESAGFGAETRWRFNEIISQEIEHIGELRRTINMMGAQPTQPCQYNLPPIPNVQAFLNVTDIVNGLGPSAYIGAGAFITNPVVLTTGSSIGEVEARHNSWLNGIIGRDEFPTTYQLSLNPTQAYGVVAPYFASCPASNPKLNAVQAYPPGLNATNPGAPGLPLTPGATINLQPGSGFKAPSSVNVAFLYSFNTTIVPYDVNAKTAQVPSDAAGQVYAILTTATQGQTLTIANTLTAPVPFFVDVPASRFRDVKYGNRQYS